MSERSEMFRNRMLALGVLGGLFWALGCGNSDSQDADAKAPAPLLPGYELKGGLQVPPRQIQDPGLPDSCDLLTQASPTSMLDEPFAPAERMSNVCIAYAASTPTFEKSLSVELRRPEELERERDDKGLPTNEEQFWIAEGAGIGLVGGDREEVEEIPGLGDYSVWYPIRDGMALHTYWGGDYILAVNVRGIPVEKGLAWAKEVSKAAIGSTLALRAMQGSGDAAQSTPPAGGQPESTTQPGAASQPGSTTEESSDPDAAGDGDSGEASEG